MSNFQSVEELLEQAEKTQQQKAIKTEQPGDGGDKGNGDAKFNHKADFVPLGDDGKNDRRHNNRAREDRRGGNNRYSTDGANRESRDLSDNEDRRSDEGSANGSVRSRRRSRSPRGGRYRDERRYRSRSRNRGGRGGPRDDDEDRYYRPDPRSRVDRRDTRRDADRRDGCHGDRHGGRHRAWYRVSRHGYEDLGGSTCLRSRVDRRDTRRDADRRDDRRDNRRDDRRGDRRDTRERRQTPPEPTDDDRDKRTVFVQQLSYRLRTKQVTEFFETGAGPVKDTQIVKDRISMKSKGVGYVEFKDEESVQKALQLTGKMLFGMPVIVQLTEAEKNRQARNTEGVATLSNGIPFHRLYVGNIHFSISEEDLKGVFEPFGALEFCQLQKEEAGRSKGYGFVQFTDPDEAKEALEKMNGFELAGRPIRVGLGNDKFTPESTQSLMQRFGGSQAQQAQAQAQGSSFSGMGGRGAHAGGTANFDRAGGKDAEKTGGASALDDTDVAGVNFSNYSRNDLMRKLARNEDNEPKAAIHVQQAKPAPINEPAASRCVLLKNLYSMAEAEEAGFEKELTEDVKMECENKYGVVVHIGLPPGSADGECYIKFDRVQGGENAIKGLQGRLFGGRHITAQYVVDAVYNMNFPKAANV